MRRVAKQPANVSADLLAAAERAIASLDRLADTFAPLANRNFRRGKRTTNLREEVVATLELLDKEIRDAGIRVSLAGALDTVVAIDPGELSAVVVNLVLNAAYWLQQAPEGERRLLIQAKRTAKNGRVELTVADSGPGIDSDDLEIIMLPGVTKKPDGIGMGLTVVGEVVEGHNGKLVAISPGGLGGATFSLDLPVARRT